MGSYHRPFRGEPGAIPINVTPSLLSPGFCSPISRISTTARRWSSPGRVGYPVLRHRTTTLVCRRRSASGWNWSKSSTWWTSSATSAAVRHTDSTVQGGRAGAVRPDVQHPINWQTGITCIVFHGTWKLQPAIAIVNQTSQGPFMIRNQFTNGQFLRQANAPVQRASVPPSSLLPGFGPSPGFAIRSRRRSAYAYAPGSTVDSAFAYALDPTRELHRPQRSAADDQCWPVAKPRGQAQAGAGDTGQQRRARSGS